MINWLKRIFRSKKSKKKNQKPPQEKNRQDVINIPDIKSTHDLFSRKERLRGDLLRMGMADQEMELLFAVIGDEKLAKFLEQEEDVRDRIQWLLFTQMKEIRNIENQGRTGTSSSPLSDKTLKCEVRPLANSLNKVMALQGVSFKWRYPEVGAEVFDEKWHIGLLAQDVEKVIPEVIITTSSGYLGIEYDKVVALLIEAVKELQVQIQELREQSQLCSSRIA